MATWGGCKLGDLFHINHGYAFKGEFFSNAGEYVLLTPGNFREKGGLQLKGEKEKYYTGEFPVEYLLRHRAAVRGTTDALQQPG